MNVTLANGQQLRGDVLKTVTVRSDLVPIPQTVELEVRTDAGIEGLLKEGARFSVGKENYIVIKVVVQDGQQVQGDRVLATLSVIGLIESCAKVAYVKSNAIIKNNATLSNIYRACGAVLREIKGDFAVPRFACLTGSVPTFHIARILQEEGGCMRYKNGVLEFLRIAEVFRSNPIFEITTGKVETVKNQFMERHSIATFFSLDSGGGFIGNRAKDEHHVLFSPFKDLNRLNSIRQVLIRTKTAVLPLNANICAGDLIKVAGQENPVVVITAAHSFSTNTDNDAKGQYTKLWLGEMA